VNRPVLGEPAIHYLFQKYHFFELFLSENAGTHLETQEVDACVSSRSHPNLGSRAPQPVSAIAAA
jgi:hypothetical protein